MGLPENPDTMGDVSSDTGWLARRPWLAAAIVLAAIAATAIHGWLVAGADFTIRVVNVGQTPITELSIAQDPKVWLAVPALAPGKSVELKLHNPPRREGLLRYTVGDIATANPIALELGPSFWRAKITYEYRLHEQGLAGSRMLWKSVPFVGF